METATEQTTPEVNPYYPIVKGLCQSVDTRIKTLNIKGRKRQDELVLDFFIGAALALQLSGNKDAYSAVSTWAALILPVRGYSAIKEELGRQ